jgi:hypothetical protein
VLRLLSGCRNAHAEGAVGSASMRWLWRTDLGSEEIAYRTAQSLYSLYRSVRVTDPPKWVRQTISTVMPRAMSVLPPIADICCAQADVRFVPIADVACCRHGLSVRLLHPGHHHLHFCGHSRAAIFLEGGVELG